MNKIIKHMLLGSVAIVALQGCGLIDEAGRHLPVIGERCENWECFTSSGQAQSEANKRALAAREKGEQKRVPINAAGSPYQQPQASPAADVEQDEKKLTPFDMTPEQLDNLPSPSAYPAN